MYNYEKYKDNPKYTYVYALEDYDTYIKKLIDSEGELALDSETYCLPKYRAIAKGRGALCPHMGRMSILMLKPRSFKTVIFDLRLLEEQDYDRRPMYELLKAKRLIAFRAQFDLKFIKRHYGFIPPDVLCLNYLAKLVGNATGSKFARQTGRSLKDILRELFNVKAEGKGAEQVSDWYPRPDENDEAGLKYWFVNKLEYGVGDVAYLHRIADVLLPVVCNQMYKTDLFQEGVTDITKAGLGMNYIMELDMEAARVAAEMEYNGMGASAEVFSKMQLAIHDESTDEGSLIDVASKLCEIFKLETIPNLWGEGNIPAPNSWKILNSPTKFKHKVNEFVGIDMDSLQAAQLHRIVILLDQLDNCGEMELISDDEHELYKELETIEKGVIAQTSKAISLLLEYKKLQKLKSFNLGSKINPLTGAIHSGVDMLGAGTGRSSSSAPNNQQIPSRVQVEIELDTEGTMFKSAMNLKAMIPDWTPVEWMPLP